MAPSSPAPSANNAFEFYASCPEGFEDALADELRSLGLRHVRRLKGRVSFGGGVADAYRACLWSRLASRVFVTLARFDCQTADDLYKGSKAVAWEDVLVPGATIAISARGVTDALRNSHFSALRIKDAICDRLVQATGRRPDVDTDDPDARILATIRRDRVSLQLDLAGDPLFKRLPREATRPGGAHVLRPDYAALSLSHIKWGRACAESTLPFLVDACCAGGGIVLEAAQTLADRGASGARARCRGCIRRRDARGVRASVVGLEGELPHRDGHALGTTGAVMVQSGLCCLRGAATATGEFHDAPPLRSRPWPCP